MSSAPVLKPVDWIDTLFAKKDANNQRRCLYPETSRGGGIDGNQPVLCTHQPFSDGTSSGNYAKHLCSHVLKKHTDWRTLEKAIRQYYPKVASHNLGPSINQSSLARQFSSDESNKQSLKRSINQTDIVSQSSKPVKSQRQSTIEESTMQMRNEEFLQKMAVCFASCSWAHQIASKGEFIEMMDAYRNADIDVPGRDEVAPMIMHRKASVMKQLIKLLKSQSPKSPVTIAFDAWDNICRIHITNIMLLCKGKAYFWCSIAHTDGKADTSTVVQQLESTIRDLTAQGIVISAANADNASVNKAAFKELRKMFPSIAFLPCGAHVLQLCVQRAFKTNSRAMAVRKASKGLVSHILKNKHLRLELVNAQKREVATGRRKHVVQLVRPNLTRWSSDYFACQRLVALEHIIIYLLTQDPFELPAGYWDDVKLLGKFLKPFTVATDIIQSDSAGLLDVFIQFSTLESHCAAEAALNGALAGFAASMRDAIRMYWKKHVHEESVLSCVHLSASAVRQASFFQIHPIRSWRTWFSQWGLSYITANHSHLSECGRLPLPTLIDNFHSQAAAFDSRDGVFDTADQEVQSALDTAGDSSSNSTYIVYDARRYWNNMLPIAPELSYVALALLSINCSEASVERSFSMQADTHRLKRNRLGHLNVETEVFVKLNTLALKNVNIRKPTVHVLRAQHLDGAEADIQVLEADSAEEDSDDDILDEEVEDALEDDEFARFEVEDAEEVAEEDDEILVQPAAQSQRPVRASFGYVPSVTVQWDRFCNDFIAAHQLTADKTWKRRGLLTTLESALRDDHDLKREQVSDVKKHIDFILSNQPEQ